MKLRLRHDWVRVEIEPPREKTRGGIVIVGAQPIRMARVLDVGPGLWFGTFFRKMQLKVGERFPFFKAATETAQGYMLAYLLPDNEALIRETDVLFVIEEGDPEVSF